MGREKGDPMGRLWSTSTGSRQFKAECTVLQGAKKDGEYWAVVTVSVLIELGLLMG